MYYSALRKNRHKNKNLHVTSPEKYDFFVNISSYVSTGNRAGFERWAQLNNLKEAARTFNYLSENNLLNYEDFRQHIADIDNSFIATEQRISELSSEISHQELIQKHCSSVPYLQKNSRRCKKQHRILRNIKPLTSQNTNCMIPKTAITGTGHYQITFPGKTAEKK